MNRTNNCGELSKANLSQTVKLSGWVNKIREKGFIIWIDLRDRYGITQLVFDKDRSSEEIFSNASKLGREFVIEVEGTVIERKSINERIKTGEIEILVSSLTILNKSLTPPFTIENESDGGEELRMKYRYLDIRREPVKENLIFRHELSLEVRNYLSENSFIDIETPYLIKSTPEGARDFIVPSRLNPDHYYALPQSPQIFKQLLMVGGIDKYYQIVKCFRDEDLRADRQPEFTQIDCEMSFVNQEDIFQQFEGLMSRLFSKFLNKTDISFERMTYKFAS
jgi:aspartyl-tRNA synthetase